MNRVRRSEVRDGGLQDLIQVCVVSPSYWSGSAGWHSGCLWWLPSLSYTALLSWQGCCSCPSAGGCSSSAGTGLPSFHPGSSKVPLAGCCSRSSTESLRLKKKPSSVTFVIYCTDMCLVQRTYRGLPWRRLQPRGWNKAEPAEPSGLFQKPHGLKQLDAGSCHHAYGTTLHTHVCVGQTDRQTDRHRQVPVWCSSTMSSVLLWVTLLS